MIDSHDNVWLIDFFHTHRGHVLRDLIKLENDLLYIFTPVNSVEDLDQAVLLIDCLLQVEDLRRPLPDIETTGLTSADMRRTYETICFLRSFYPLLIHDDRNLCNSLLVSSVMPHIPWLLTSPIIGRNSGHYTLPGVAALT